ncbi:hypothetical protein [Streptomyces liliifuscus]|uniref:Uncharacterized protein n=1 Tax=Streptomyces liliifuscus TaxID=2797636 RepID=A0A7T7L6H5_9ACTN|nr:hypothetical protein [Streptomyces liliifuscus]QQM47333.1 hypothetical protein JEQ17_20200 [Streptomyces liliifuscus]
MTHFYSDRELDDLLHSVDDRILESIEDALDMAIGLAAITGAPPNSTVTPIRSTAAQTKPTERRHAEGPGDSAPESRLRAQTPVAKADSLDGLRSEPRHDEVRMLDNPMPAPPEKIVTMLDNSMPSEPASEPEISTMDNDMPHPPALDLDGNK